MLKPDQTTLKELIPEGGTKRKTSIMTAPHLYIYIYIYHTASHTHSRFCCTPTLMSCTNAAFRRAHHSNRSFHSPPHSKKRAFLSVCNFSSPLHTHTHSLIALLSRSLTHSLTLSLSPLRCSNDECRPHFKDCTNKAASLLLNHLLLPSINTSTLHSCFFLTVYFIMILLYANLDFSIPMQSRITMHRVIDPFITEILYC